MREVLPALLAALERGEPVALATVVRTWRSSRGPAGSALLVTVSDGVDRCGERRLRRGGRGRARPRGARDGRARRGDLRRQRRRRVRGGPDLRRHPRGARRARLTRTWPGARRVAREHRRPRSPSPWRRSCAGPGSSGGGSWCAAGAIEGSIGDVASTTVGSRMLGAGLGETAGSHYGPEGERLGRPSRSSSPRTRRRRGWSSSARSTSCRAVPGGRGRSASGSPCATRGRCSPRRAASRDADEVVVDWPHRWLEPQPLDERTVICVLTHDPKFDVPALTAAVRTPAGYVGAMGSRRTHADRVAGSGRPGLTDEEVARIHSPIGLDLGAGRPRRPPCRSQPRSCRCAGGAPARPLSAGRVRSTPGRTRDRRVGLVLAAGAGRRLGGPKARVVVAGERLVDRAVRVLREGGLRSRLVVLGAWVGEVPGADRRRQRRLGRRAGVVAARRTAGRGGGPTAIVARDPRRPAGAHRGAP